MLSQVLLKRCYILKNVSCWLLRLVSFQSSVLTVEITVMIFTFTSIMSHWERFFYISCLNHISTMIPISPISLVLSHEISAIDLTTHRPTFQWINFDWLYVETKKHFLSFFYADGSKCRYQYIKNGIVKSGIV